MFKTKCKNKDDINRACVFKTILPVHSFLQFIELLSIYVVNQPLLFLF